jgi:acyl-coenzyme A thioesterase PaaI-like protein
MCGVSQSKSVMPESLRTKAMRYAYNFFPAYRGTGARISYIASDFREIRVRIPLNWRTRNYVGTIFGGSMFGGVDPVYMVMLIKNLGPEYAVWDKSARIEFKKPGRNELHACFILTSEELSAIRNETESSRATERTYHIEITDREGNVCASVQKTIFIRRRK